jgi:glycosyltransferase involved in cell wall biosynthesis
MVFPGVLSESLEGIIKRFSLTEYAVALPNQADKEACALQRPADLLLPILYSGAGGEDRIAAKLFEYLASCRPILAIVPRGEVAQIIESTHPGIVASPDDPQDIERCLALLYENRHQFIEGMRCDDREIRRFDRREQARKLPSVLDEARTASVLGKATYDES